MGVHRVFSMIYNYRLLIWFVPDFGQRFQVDFEWLWLVLVPSLISFVDASFPVDLGVVVVVCVS